MKTTKTRTLGLNILVIATMVIIMPSFMPQQQQQALAKIFVYNRLLNIDTDKPLAPQFDQMWSKFKANLTTSQWKNFTDTWPVDLENATSRCMNMSMIFKGISFDCSTKLALVVINCQAKVL